MNDATLRGDCSRCIGLCCFALAFDRGALFAFDKPAGTVCSKLGTDNRCGIHASLAAEGFAGCAEYDCLGTGQLVTAMFEGRSWREGGAVARAMATALGLLRDIQAARMVLHRLPSTAERQALLAELDPTGGWTYARLLEVHAGAYRERLGGLVRGASRDDGHAGPQRSEMTAGTFPAAHQSVSPPSGDGS